MSEVNESAAARRSRAIPSWRFVHVGRGRSKRGRPPLRQKNVPTSAKESQTASRQPLVFLDRGKLNSGRLLQAEETDRLGTPSLYSGSSEDGEDVATPDESKGTPPPIFTLARRRVESRVGRMSSTKPGEKVVSRKINVSPFSILGDGSSDPFTSYAVAVTPEVHNLLILYRDYVLPAEYLLSEFSWATSAAARQDWENILGGMGDLCLSNGFLAMTATILAAVRPNRKAEKQALMYRTRSMALLRSRMADPTLTENLPLGEIYFLLAAAVYGRNLREAQLHARMMQALCVKQLQMTGEVDVTALTRVIYLDIQISAIYLERPTFDVDNLLPKVYEPVWQMAEKELPPMDQITSTFVDPSVDSERLQDLFMMHRQALAVLTMPDTEVMSTPVMTAWLVSRSTICEGRLINYYLWAAEEAAAAAAAAAKSSAIPKEVESGTGKKDYPASDSHYYSTQAFLSLALLYWSRTSSATAKVGGVSLYDAEANILQTLQKVIGDSDADLSTNSDSRHDNAKLWALFVGAQAEQTNAKPDADPSKDWFNVGLARQAKRMGLMSWQQVRRILEGFAFNDFMQPNGANWFFKTISTNLDS